MNLRNTLREKAEAELAGVVDEARSALQGLHNAVTGKALAVLAFGNRTATMRKVVINSMVNAMEERLIAKFKEEQTSMFGDTEDDLGPLDGKDSDGESL